MLTHPGDVKRFTEFIEAVTCIEGDGATPNPVGPLWCNARIRAVPFYTRHRFNEIGEPFDFPGVGEHLKMIYIGELA